MFYNGFRRKSVRSSWWGFQPGASASGSARCVRVRRGNAGRAGRADQAIAAGCSAVGCSPSCCTSWRLSSSRFFLCCSWAGCSPTADTAVEIGDWHRLTGRSIGAYLGLVPAHRALLGFDPHPRRTHQDRQRPCPPTACRSGPASPASLSAGTQSATALGCCTAGGSDAR